MVFQFKSRRLAFALTLFISLNADFGAAKAFETLAKEVVLMDADTGAILFEKNAHVPMAP